MVVNLHTECCINLIAEFQHYTGNQALNIIKEILNYMLEIDIFRNEIPHNF